MHDITYRGRARLIRDLSERLFFCLFVFGTIALFYFSGLLDLYYEVILISVLIGSYLASKLARRYVLSRFDRTLMPAVNDSSSKLFDRSLCRRIRYVKKYRYAFVEKHAKTSRAYRLSRVIRVSEVMALSLVVIGFVGVQPVLSYLGLYFMICSELAYVSSPLSEQAFLHEVFGE